MLVLASGNNVNVAVKMVDLMEGKKRFYALCNAKFFDPRNGFKPCLGAPEGTRRLYDGYEMEYHNLIPQAEAEFESRRKAYQPKPQPIAQAGLGGSLEQALIQVLAEQSTDKVLEAAKPILEKHIVETFGVLPKVHEVHSPKGIQKVEGITHERFDTVLNLINADIPVFLTGAAGTGKNVICKQVAKALNLEFYFSNAVTQEYKLTGFIDANGRYHETQFFQAFTKGGLFMLDEMDASVPEVLIILNAAIANRYFDFPTGRVEAHEDFRVIAAGNTFGTGADMEYTGRYQLDAASLDRFAMVEIDYSPAIEEAVAQGDSELVAFVRAFRNAVVEAGMKHLATYRAIERMAKLKTVLSPEEVLKISLLKGLGKDDIRILNEIIRNAVGNNKYAVSMRKLVA